MISGLVSIAIPAYKRRWLKEAIESALSQDYDNIELIIVDDHSPQNLKEVVEPYLLDKRVSYFYNETNIGKESVVNNWNRCLEYVRGEFFVLLCDDDVLMPDFVSTLLKLAVKYPQCNVFHGRRILYDEVTGEIIEEDPWLEYEDYGYISEAFHKHTITEFLYRTCVLKKEKFVVFPSGLFSDNATILKLAKNGGIASSCEVICQFRKSSEHISGSNQYAYEKAKAAILYSDWFQNNVNESYNNKQKRDRLDIWLQSFFRYASLLEKIKILFIVPFDVWSYKQKIYMFLSLFRVNK